MRFVSTRGLAPSVVVSEAIARGAAPDGGLYWPSELPRIDAAAIDPALPLPALAARLLASFFAGDPLGDALPAICAEAFAFPIPLTAPDPARPDLRVLELFHGPTAAFKDFGARFLLGCFDRLPTNGERTILVATSGDTGGAVGAAAEGKRGLRAFILYPKGRVSTFQAHQLGCWDAPVRALEVAGDFDACQQLVKAAFADAKLAARHGLTSANSINPGRLLPQMVWFADAALKLHAETGTAPGMIVPTGNLGHAVAALTARAIGLPIGPIIAATNANAALRDWSESGRYRPRASVATLANAMDVGAPSNFERLAAFPGDDRALAVERVDDDAIRARIRDDFAAFGHLWDPHTATAAEAHARMSAPRRAERPWVVAATAHPFKFAEIVTPLTGAPVAPPPALAAVLTRESRADPIAPSLSALAAALS